MANKFFLSFTLLIIWFALSGFFKPLFIFFGICSVLIVVLIFSRMEKVSHQSSKKDGVRLFSIKFFKYCLWLIKEMIVSSIHIACEMLREKPNVNPQLKWLPHKLKKDESIALYANSITLTPGTVCIYTTDKEMLVHAIQKEGIDDLKTGTMHDKVKETFGD